MLAITCPSCGHAYAVAESLAGKEATCPGCGRVTVVPLAATIGSTAGEDQQQLPQAPAPDLATTAPPPHAGAAPMHSVSGNADATATGTPADGPDSYLTGFLAPPQTADELGRLGKYRIVKVLGHGGM